MPLMIRLFNLRERTLAYRVEETMKSVDTDKRQRPQWLAEEGSVGQTFYSITHADASTIQILSLLAFPADALSPDALYHRLLFLLLSFSSSASHKRFPSERLALLLLRRRRRQRLLMMRPRMLPLLPSQVLSLRLLLRRCSSRISVVVQQCHHSLHEIRMQRQGDRRIRQQVTQ